MSALVALGLVGLILLLVALGQPVFVLLGSVVAYLLLMGGVFDDFSNLNNIVEMTLRLADDPLLLAIPFFVIAGSLMTEGDIANRLIRIAKSVFGWLPGGLAISATFACVFFAAISGSSPVTVIAIGSIMYPALVRDGYGKRFSTGLVTSAGSLGILIPPSIPMLVYAIADPTKFAEPVQGGILPPGNTDILGVTDLFLAGVGPGLLIAVLISSYAIFQGVRRRVPRLEFSWGEVGAAFRDGVWALGLPVLILGGIYSGVFTPTEAACVAVVYALIVELFIHRSIGWTDLHHVFSESFLLMGSLLLILAVAQGFTTYLARAEVAKAAVDFLVYELSVGPVGFLLFVNIFLLMIGCFMDIISAILILAPILAPIAIKLGIHPLLLGVVFIVNLEIGYLTPPLGINLFVMSTLFRHSLGHVIRSVLPFTMLMLGALMAITYIPTIALGPVSLAHGGNFIVPFPEAHLPMYELETPRAFDLFSALQEESEQDAPPEPPSDRPMTMQEMTAMAMRDLEREQSAGIQYANFADLLSDFRRVMDGELVFSVLAERGNDSATP